MSIEEIFKPLEKYFDPIIEKLENLSLMHWIAIIIGIIILLLMLGGYT